MFKLKDVIKENGATLNKNGVSESYENGYQVSCEDLEIIPKSKLRKKTFNKSIRLTSAE